MAARGSTATIELVRGEMAAASLPGDLIVMATQERTGPARWQLGDAAEELLRHAQAPLLLIRAKPRG
jgi:nucleotide-binding universal stress UspA family protein